jgi:endoglucanase
VRYRLLLAVVALALSSHCGQILIPRRPARHSVTALSQIFPGPPATKITPASAAQRTPWTRAWFDDYSKLPLERNPSGPSTVFSHFTKAEEYVAKTGKRMYLGEFGAVDNADPGSRLNYIKLVREEAERHGFGWAYWDDGGKNKGMDVTTGSWVPVIEAALFER